MNSSSKDLINPSVGTALLCCISTRVYSKKLGFANKLWFLLPGFTNTMQYKPGAYYFASATIGSTHGGLCREGVTVHDLKQEAVVCAGVVHLLPPVFHFNPCLPL